MESAIKERVKRLLNADIIDVTPNGIDLDEELGVYERIIPEEDEEEDELTPASSPEEGDDE